MKMLAVILFIFFQTQLLIADYIAFSPDLFFLKQYVKGFESTFKNSKSSLKFYIVDESKFFSDSESILSAVQQNIINFAVIPLKTFNRLNKSGELTSILKKTYQIKDVNTDFSDVIPFKLALQNYGIFLLDLLEGGKYYLFSNNLVKTYKNLSIAVNNKLFVNILKKKFTNTFFVKKFNSLKGLMEKKFFKGVVINSFDFPRINTNFKYAYEMGLNREKLCFIVNLTYWNKLSMYDKSIVWAFCNRYKSLYRINMKKFQDRILNKVLIKKLRIH